MNYTCKEFVLYFLALTAFICLLSCKKKSVETDVTVPYIGTYSYSYSRDYAGGRITLGGTLMVSKKSNTSVLIPFSDNVNRTFRISGNNLIQDPQTIQASGIENGMIKQYTFSEESTGSLIGTKLNISGTATEPGSKPYTFTVKATRF